VVASPLAIGLNHLDLFNYVADFSSGLRPAEFEKTFTGIAANTQVANEKIAAALDRLWKDDGAMANSRAFDDFLNRHKIKHTFREARVRTPGWFGGAILMRSHRCCFQ